MSNDKPNFEKAIEWIEANVQSLKDQIVRIRHDVWCPTWWGKYCDCQPEIYLQTETELKKLNYPLDILK